MTHDHAADVGVAVAVVSGLVTDRLAGPDTRAHTFVEAP